MLHSADVINTVADVLEELGADIPLVVDPVMVAKGGASLLDPDASHAYRIHCMMERGKRDLALEAENEARLKSSEYQRMMMQRLILDMSKPD